MRIVSASLRSPDEAKRNPGIFEQRPRISLGCIRATSPGTFASLWLMGRKRPGKICRRAAVSPFGGTDKRLTFASLNQVFQ
jgi:hypothetical protein